MNCIWFRSLDCGYTWALLNTTLLFQLHRRLLLWSHCHWTELIHKAATVTFNNAHIAQVINTRWQLMKTKRKRRKIPSYAQSAYMMKWKLKHFVIRDFCCYICVHCCIFKKLFYNQESRRGLEVHMVGTVECSVIVVLEMLHCKMNLMAQRVVTYGSFLILTVLITE